jgi:hypothetical protein
MKISSGYFALLLLSITAVIENFYSQQLASFFITLAVVFCLLLALWGFERITHSANTFYKSLGQFLSATTLGGIVLLFITVLVYIGSGYPVWMDQWFRPNYIVDSPSGVTVKAGALYNMKGSVTRISKLSTLSGSFLSSLVSTAEGSENPPPNDRRTTITVTWNQNVSPDLQVEISVRERSNPARDFPPPRSFSGQIGTATITGLRSGTVYEVRVVNNINSRLSKPVILLVATDADGLQLGQTYRGFRLRYYGRLTPTSDGFNASDADGRLELSLTEPRGASSEPLAWNYTGGVNDGFPDGNGKLETDPTQCTSAMCGTFCSGQFKQGDLVSGNCSISVNGIAVPGGKGSTLYDSLSRYLGGVTEAKNAPSVIVGPLFLWFSGKGTLDAVDSSYNDKYSGEWSKGNLIKGDVNKSADSDSVSGQLSTGQQYVLIPPCLLKMTPIIAGGAIGGPAGQLSCDTVEIGEYRGDDIFRGFHFEKHADWNWAMAHWFKDGKRIVLKQSLTPGDSACFQTENFGLPAQIGEPEDKEWGVECTPSGTAPQCEVKSAATDINVMITKQSDAMASVLIRTTGTGHENETAIKIGNDMFTLRAMTKQNTVEDIFLLADMCANNQGLIINQDLRKSTPLAGFCYKLAIGVGRLLACK